MVNLIMHCGGPLVSRDAVQDAPTPERTNTWFPVPHHRLLDIAQSTIEAQGYSVTNEAHGLWGEGARYFGLLELADQNPSREVEPRLNCRSIGRSGSIRFNVTCGTVAPPRAPGFCLYMFRRFFGRRSATGTYLRPGATSAAFLSS